MMGVKRCHRLLDYENNLKALNKTQLIDLFLKMQDKTNSNINSSMKEMENVYNSFTRFQSGIQIVKTINNYLLKQLQNNERQC